MKLNKIIKEEKIIGYLLSNDKLNDFVAHNLKQSLMVFKK